MDLISDLSSFFKPLVRKTIIPKKVRSLTKGLGFESAYLDLYKNEKNMLLAFTRGIKIITMESKLI